MRSRIFRYLEFVPVFLTLLIYVPITNAQGSAYNFAPVNQYGINLTAEYWNPIIDYVSKKSGVKLTLKLGRTSADTTIGNDPSGPATPMRRLLHDSGSRKIRYGIRMRDET